MCNRTWCRGVKRAETFKFKNMHGDLTAITLFVGIFGMIVSAIYFGNRKKERLALIAAGREASLFNEGKKNSGVMGTLKIGFLLIGLGVGALLGEALVMLFGFNEGVAYLSMILICGGISLLLFYFRARHLEQNG